MNKLFAFILFMILILGGCGSETKTLPEFYEKNLNDVTKIVIVDGNSGEKKTIENGNDIKKFLDAIEEIKFVPEENQEERTGFNYSITLFENSEQTFQFGLTVVNDHYYYTEPEIYHIVDDFYNNLDVQEE